MFKTIVEIQNVEKMKYFYWFESINLICSFSKYLLCVFKMLENRFEKDV